MIDKPIRTSAVAEACRELPAAYAEAIHGPLLAAEAKLTDVMEILEERGMNTLGDALQWLRDDVRALRWAAADAALS